MKTENQKLIEEIETMKTVLTQLQAELEDNQLEPAMHSIIVVDLGWPNVKKAIKALYANRNV